MSRSYKKHPGYCDRNIFMKKYFNRSVRRANKVKLCSYEEELSIPPRGGYKKFNCSYDIRDYDYVIYNHKSLNEEDWQEFSLKKHKWYIK